MITTTARRVKRPDRDLDHDKTGRRQGIHSVHDTFDTRANPWPTGRRQDEDTNPARRQILLVLEVLIGRDQQGKIGVFGACSNSPFFSRAQPRLNAVSTSCPVKNVRSGTGVPWSKRMRNYAAATALRAACASTARTWSSVTPGNHSRNS